MEIENPTPPSPITAYGVDVNIEEIKKAVNSLSWLDRLFGRAITLYEEEGGRRVPKVYLGKGEYFNCFPNDAQKSFCFFYPIGEMTPTEESVPFAADRYYTQALSMVVWGNLERIEPNTIGLGEQLKTELIQKLGKVRGVVVKSIISDDIGEVYSGWDYNKKNSDFYHPNYAMRVEMDVSVIINCI